MEASVGSVRLVLRMQRFEIAVVATIAAALAIAAFWVARQLDAVGFGACFAAIEAPPAGCELLGRQFYAIQEDWGSPVASLMGLLPYAIGLFLGAPVIAREIERGTARLAWSVTTSRVRWYVWRVLPIVGVAVVLGVLAGFAMDRFVTARTPGIDLANSFDTFGQRGVLVVMTTFVIVAGAIGLGSVIGRVLPTVILALVLGSLGVFGVHYLHSKVTASEAVPVGEEEIRPGDLYVDQFFRMADGRLVGWQELEQIDPEGLYGEEGPRYPIVTMVIPAERYREIEAREALILGSIGVVMLVGAGVIVARRRPG
jgi:hypothetical protein